MVNNQVENFAEGWYRCADLYTCRKTFCAKSSASVPSLNIRYARFMTGCLYFSTNSANAASSPRLTRSIRLASRSGVDDIDLVSTKHRFGDKVLDYCWALAFK